MLELLIVQNKMYLLVSVIVLLLVKSSQQANENEIPTETASLIDNNSNDNASLTINEILEDLEPYNSTFEQIDLTQNETDYLQSNESGPVETIVYAPIIIHLSNPGGTFRKKNPLQQLLHGIVPHGVLRPITQLFGGGHHHHQGPLAFLNPFFYLSRNLNGTQEATTN